MHLGQLSSSRYSTASHGMAPAIQHHRKSQRQFSHPLYLHGSTLQPNSNHDGAYDQWHKGLIQQPRDAAAHSAWLCTGS